ncbi:MAG: hypothetical protein AUG08_08505 [Acidobacteria bacterium 13_1_20CM_2_55_15]|nr:MAG: hypothetical protein AUG08_08505 [Acidobacteria bacterium 13_1_20CM_2_55_15]
MTQITTLIAAFALLAAPAFSDTLVLKNGEKISGYFEGGSPRVIKFRASDGVVKDYDLLSVQQIQFGEEKTASNPNSSNATTSSSNAATSRSATSGADPRLLPGTERVTRPASANAANTGWTIPTGSKIVIRMIDSVNSETNKLGDTFVAVLDEPISQGGVEVIPRGADVRGRIAKIDDAGRLKGSAQLGLELTQLIVNGIPYSVTTSEYNEVGEGRGKETAKRAGIGAGIGAAIGAIAGGGKGAAIGAGVGGGGATAIQVLTKGEKLNIPSETKLEFTLRSPLVVAGR